MVVKAKIPEGYGALDAEGRGVVSVRSFGRGERGGLLQVSSGWWCGGRLDVAGKWREIGGV